MAITHLTSQITTEPLAATTGAAVIQKTIWKSGLAKEETTPTDDGVVATWGRVVRFAVPKILLVLNDRGDTGLKFTFREC